MLMANLNDVRKMMERLDNMTGMSGAGLQFKKTRSSKILGSFVHMTQSRGGVVVKRTPVRFEFSEVILSCNESTLWEIVKHEYAHYMATVRFQDNCHHDWRFKECCREIGASADEPTFTNANLEEQSRKMAKYVVTCENCGSTTTFQRMCNTLRAIDNNDATCTICGCNHFHIKTNR